MGDDFIKERLAMVPGRIAIAMMTLFSFMATAEPLRQGPIHADVRQRSVLIEREQAPPTVRLLYPHDNELFTGSFYLGVANWTLSQKSNVYANGVQARNKGYVCGWVYDILGDRIRYYDHVTVLENGVLEIQDEFPDGDYKAYFQLKRADGTPVVQSDRMTTGDVTSVIFYVGDRGGPPPDDGDPPPDGGPPQEPYFDLTGSF